MSNKTLLQEHVVSLIREEWNERFHEAICELKDVVKTDGNAKTDVIALATGLKVKEKKTEKMYTVKSVSDNSVVLSSTLTDRDGDKKPEVTELTISREDLGTNYELE